MNSGPRNVKEIQNRRIPWDWTPESKWAKNEIIWERHFFFQLNWQFCPDLSVPFLQSEPNDSCRGKILRILFKKQYIPSLGVPISLGITEHYCTGNRPSTATHSHPVYFYLFIFCGKQSTSTGLSVFHISSSRSISHMLYLSFLLLLHRGRLSPLLQYPEFLGLLSWGTSKPAHFAYFQVLSESFTFFLERTSI